MTNLAKDQAFDSTLALVREGFLLAPNRFERYHTDIFQTRLAGLNVLFVHGEQGARLFYDNERFQRRGVIPKLLEKSFLGDNPIHKQDDAVHQNYKAMFLSMMTPANLDRLTQQMEAEWGNYIERWEGKKRIVLFTEAQELLCRVACAWTGTPIQEHEVTRRSRDFWSMVDSFGAVTPLRHLRGIFARQRTECWLKKVFADMRSGKVTADAALPIAIIARHRGIDGQLFDTKAAAVALLNLLRPIVAIATYIVFAALALHNYPAWRRRLQQEILRGNDTYLEWFVHEVRRYYPFAPFMGARTRDAFDWRGYHFPKGQLVFLDIYGTNHDAQLWENPYEFNPERFRRWEGGKFDLIPQGGGDYLAGHRCAGEWVTIQAIKNALMALVSRMTYEVPEQNLTVNLSRMPTLPKSQFVITQVKQQPERQV